MFKIACLLFTRNKCLNFDLFIHFNGKKPGLCEYCFIIVIIIFHININLATIKQYSQARNMKDFGLLM